MPPGSARHAGTDAAKPRFYALGIADCHDHWPGHPGRQPAGLYLVQSRQSPFTSRNATERRRHLGAQPDPATNQAGRLFTADYSVRWWRHRLGQLFGLGRARMRPWVYRFWPCVRFAGMRFGHWPGRAGHPLSGHRRKHLAYLRGQRDQLHWQRHSCADRFPGVANADAGGRHFRIGRQPILHHKLQRSLQPFVPRFRIERRRQHHWHLATPPDGRRRRRHPLRRRQPR